MKSRYWGIPILVYCLISLLVVSCKDDWNDHYYPELNGKSSLTIYDYIKSRPDLSIFAQMLKQKGYDTLLSKSQTFTVWAPLNSSLATVNLDDTLAVSRIVGNHITQFSIPTASVQKKTLSMLDRKLLTFEVNSNGAFLDVDTIKEADHALANGIVHVMKQYVPYKLNAWEFLTETADLDSVRSNINSLSRRVYDAKSSFNSEGAFVDSVFVDYNPIFTNLCLMKSEDSVYTTIFPTNTAWNNIYGSVYPLFKTLPSSGGVTTQVKQTKLALLQDLYFNGKITASAAKTAMPAIYGDTISNMKDVLSAASLPFNISNGIAYTTNTLNFKPLDTWNKAIKVEAESIAGVDSLKINYGMSASSSLGTIFSTSGKSYLTSIATTASFNSNLSVRFPIPNTLSTKYNIYCVFVPATIIDTTDLKPYKLNFYMTYKDANGKTVKDQKQTVTNNITDPKKITKILVAQNFSFPFCNIVNSKNEAISEPEKVSVFLKVENAASGPQSSSTDRKTYNRTIRIDYVLLEPVQ